MFKIFIKNQAWKKERALMKKIVSQKRIPKVEPVFDKNHKQIGVLVSRKEYERLLDISNDYDDYMAIVKFDAQRTKKKTSNKKQKI